MSAQLLYLTEQPSNPCTAIYFHCILPGVFNYWRSAIYKENKSRDTQGNGDRKGFFFRPHTSKWWWICGVTSATRVSKGNDPKDPRDKNRTERRGFRARNPSRAGSYFRARTSNWWRNCETTSAVSKRNNPKCLWDKKTTERRFWQVS